MRFNEMGQEKGQNYHPHYLQNLAWSLGYRNYKVDIKKTGNSWPLVWLDSSGKFQATAGNASMALPHDVSFWEPMSG